MLFAGTTEAKLDAKGRVFFPSEFRRQLTEADTQLVLKRDAFQQCLVVYPFSVWQAEVAHLRQRINRWDRREAMFFRQFLADAQMLTLDASGRILIPRANRRFRRCRRQGGTLGCCHDEGRFPFARRNGQHHGRIGRKTRSRRGMMR